MAKHPLFTLFVGGLLGVLTTLGGAALSNKSTVDQFWRDQRLGTYTGFVANARAVEKAENDTAVLVVGQVSSRREREDAAEQLRTAAADLRSDCNVMALLAGPPVSGTVATYCDRHAELMELLVTSLVFADVANEQPVKENLTLIEDVQSHYPVAGVIEAVREELEVR